MKERPHLPSARRFVRRCFGTLALAVVSIAPSLHAAPPQDCSQPSRGITPLDDLAGRYWQGVEGGLYPGGTNACPEDHLQAGRKIAKSIVPLGVDGAPASDGIVGVAAIGFSFTHQVFETLQELAATDGELDPALRLIDATARGHDLEDLRDPANDYWLTLLPAQLANAGVTAEQIQVVWVMEGARFQPAPFPDHVDLFADDWTSLLNVLRVHLPNVQLAFLSPVHWQGYSWFAPYDEPFYFEQGFAVREVIARQLAGAPELAYDLPGGTAPAPWLAWGPYFWTDGEEPRSDGLALDCADFLWEGSHLSASGRDKLSPRLLHLLKSHRACTPWSIVPGSSPAERMADVELLGGASSGVRGEPRLCGSALPTVPYVGDYQLLARNALPSGNGVVVLGEQLFPGNGIAIGAGYLRVEPALVLPIHFGAKGNGALVMGEIPFDATLLDLCVYAQLAVFDSSATGGVALSQALELRLGD